MLDRKLTLSQKNGLIGWLFLATAAIMIGMMSFFPMISGFFIALQTGAGVNMRFAGLSNFERLLVDPLFRGVISNNFLYLAIQVPIMLVLALILASMLNNPKLRFKGLFRTCIFLPCATSLVSSAVIFRSLFATNGYINTVLVNLGILESSYNFLGNTWSARMVIIIAITWRWTGFNMVFYLAGLQNIERSIFEAAKIDGASVVQTFFKITIPLLKPIILLTAIMATNGTLQLFDESMNLTMGGPANTSMTISHYIFNVGFQGTANFGYAAALSYVVFILVATMSLIQLKVVDRR